MHGRHGHSHGLVDRSIFRSHAGIRAVVVSAALVAIGLERADPLVGIAITAVILRVTLASWQTVRYSLHEHDPPAW
jgi:Co/Zn/Cd efflux system component